MAVSVFPDYPQSAFGNKRVSMADVTGLNPYTVITIANPPTGGQLILASDLGLTTIEYAAVMGNFGTAGGTYTAVVFLAQAAAAAKLHGVTSIRLQWVLSISGAEAGAVDLTAATVRLMAIGY